MTITLTKHRTDGLSNISNAMSVERETVRLEFESLSVYFGATKALNNLSFDLQPGEIVGLLGHNGAGKSTVLNVATGAVPLTSGVMKVDGLKIPQPLTPKAASDLGLAVIHQEPALAQNLSVEDNLLLMKDVSGGHRQRRTRAEQALRRVDPSGSISLEQPVLSLSLGQRQMVDLARSSLSGDIKVLFLDEPTAALGDEETRALHSLVRDYAAKGTAVVYVSHRLPDILDVCTRIIVLQNGEIVSGHNVEDLTPELLATALAPNLEQLEQIESNVGETVLRLPGQSALTVREGEVVGLFGMAAGSQFRLLEQLYGLIEPIEAELQGTQYAPRRPRDAIKQGVHLVPADREKDGLVAGLSAFDNVMLPWKGVLKARKHSLAETYRLARRAFNIVGPDPSAPIAEFSGGNRQKHLLARWIFPVTPKLLLLAQPTQGVDIAAKQDIRRVVRRLAASGCAILVASAETDEIASLCDRAYVFNGERHRHLAMSEHFESQLLSTLLDLANLNHNHKTMGNINDN